MDIQAKELRFVINKPSLKQEFAAKLWGNSEGEPWLLLHGWLDNASSFDVLAPLLVQRFPNAQFLAVDLAGHGYSSHRSESVYHHIDYVADAYAITEAMGWKQFNLIGHSLGQSIASILAGTFPDKVKGLVMIEGIGSYTDAPEDIPDIFAKSLKSIVEEPKPKKVYDSPKAAATRRVQGNAVGKIPFSAAEILVSRGTAPIEQQPSSDGGQRILVSENGPLSVWEVKVEDNIEKRPATEKVAWNFDEGVKLGSRLRLTEPIVESFFTRITCPTLLILAEDGMWSVRGAKPYLITTVRGRLFVRFMYFVSVFLSWIPFIGRRFASLAKKVRMGYILGRRYTIIKNLVSVTLKSGGHHPHLLPEQATVIASEINKWISTRQLRK